jgi:hypothetical protein
MQSSGKWCLIAMFADGLDVDVISGQCGVRGDEKGCRGRLLCRSKGCRGRLLCRQPHRQRCGCIVSRLAVLVVSYCCSAVKVAARTPRLPELGSQRGEIGGECCVLHLQRIDLCLRNFPFPLLPPPSALPEHSATSLLGQRGYNRKNGHAHTQLSSQAERGSRWGRVETERRRRRKKLE